MGQTGCLRYIYMASASDEDCGDVNQFYFSFGLVVRLADLYGDKVL